MLRLLKKKEGEQVSKQFEQSHSFYFLLSGEVNFSISVKNNSDEFSVGRSDEEFTPIGWSGFRSPNRYATTVTCNKPSILARWSHDDLSNYFEDEPLIGKEFLYFVLKKSVHLLNQLWAELSKFNNSDWYVDFGQDVGSMDENENIAIPEPLELLRQSPFF